MRKEALLFAGSVVLSVACFGLTGAAGLFVFGFCWLIFGGENEVA
jgi:hypothetical protein